MYSHFKQRKDYTCGPAALSFFMHQANLGLHEEPLLEQELLTTPQEGTNPRNIVLYLQQLEVPIEHGQIPLHSAKLPMLVNYWDEDDGHYGVITELSVSKYVRLFDPAKGHIVQIPWQTFVTNWYSIRYGANWALCLR